MLETGATANLVCFELLGLHNSILERWGCPRAEAFPPHARLKFGDGRLGQVRLHQKFRWELPWVLENLPPVLEADVPALLRKWALEAQGGRLNFARITLALS